MSIAVLAAVRLRGTVRPMLIAGVLYLGYAATIRSYFALILAIALAAGRFAGHPRSRASPVRCWPSPC